LAFGASAAKREVASRRARRRMGMVLKMGDE
jgi:hypothetical protein